MNTLSSFLKYLYYRLHVMQVTAWVYRWLFERRYLGLATVATYTDFKQIESALNRLVYRPDRLGNTISYPERTQYFIDHPAEMHDATDCDEFALYIATALLKSKAAGHFGNVSNAYLMSVTYAKADGEVTGHNVCLFRVLDQLYADNRWGYMDYGRPQYFPTKEAVARAVADRYAPGGELLTWCVSDPRSLSPLEVHFETGDM